LILCRYAGIANIHIGLLSVCISRCENAQADAQALVLRMSKDMELSDHP
jgi:hypothetical protein